MSIYPLNRVNEAGQKKKELYIIGILVAVEFITAVCLLMLTRYVLVVLSSRSNPGAWICSCLTPRAVVKTTI